MVLHRMLLAGLVAVVILAPLPFGSVETWARSCMTSACLGLGILWVLGRIRSGLAPLPFKDPVLLAGTLFIIVGVVQIIPFSRPVLQTLSPRVVEIRDRYESPAEPYLIALDNPSHPFKGTRPLSLDPWSTRQAIMLFMALVLVVLIAIDLAGQARARRVLVMALVVGGGFQAIYGLFEYVTARQHIFGYAKRFYTDVATGTFINRNHFAGYMAMTLPLAIALASEVVGSARTRAWPGQKTIPATSSGRDLYIASALLMVALTMATSLAASQSRMGILSAFLSITAAGLLIVWRSKQTIYGIASLLLGSGTLMVVLQGHAGKAIIERFAILHHSMQSIVGRWQIWTETIAMNRQFPLFGIGWGAYPVVIPFFREGGRGVSYDHAHNDYLELLSEVGILGAAVASIGLFIILLPLIRKPSSRPDYGLLGYGTAAAVMAICLHSLTDFNLAIPANALTFAVLVGLVIAWRRVPTPALTPGKIGRRWGLEWRSTVIVASLGISALVALLPIVPFANSLSEPVVIDEERSSDLGTSNQQVRMTLDIGNPHRLLRMAGALGSRAQADMRALIELRPRGPFSSVTTSYIEKRLEHAATLVAQSVRLRPTLAAAHLALADLSISQCALASLVAEREVDCMGPAVAELSAAVEVNPMSAKTYEKAAKLYLAAWPSLTEEERALGSHVIRVALTSPRRAPDLLEAAALWGFEP